MAHENAANNQGDETHFWIDCPGCGYGGKIGVPLNYPADVVVCAKCREVVRVRPQDRVLWQPADPTEFLRRRFPGVDWDAIDDRPLPAKRESAERAEAATKCQRAPKSSMPTAKRSQNMLPVGVSPALDNSFVQAAIILAAGVLPLAITLLLTQPGRQAGPTVQQVAAQPPSAPNPNSAQPKTEPPQKAPDRSSPPVPPSANAVAADAQTTNKASPPESPKTPAPPPAPLPLDASAPNDVPPAAEPSSRQFYLCAWRHYRRGIEQFEQGAYAAAVGEFTEAIRFKPDSAPSFHWRAIAFIELGRLDAALDDMNRSISFRPSDPVARHARAAVFERLQRYQEARADMVDALRFSPRNHAYLTYLARLQTKIDALPASIAAVGPTPPWEERVLKLTNMGRHSYWRFVQ